MYAYPLKHALAGGEKARKALLDNLRAEVDAVLRRAPRHRPAPSPASPAGRSSSTCPFSASAAPDGSAASISPTSHEGREGLSRRGQDGWARLLGDIDPVLAASGLEAPGVHEIKPPRYGDTFAATGLALRLLSARARACGSGPVMVCWPRCAAREFGRIYAPGLNALGLDGDDVLVVEPVRARDGLWALEEGLRSGVFSGVFAMPGVVMLTPARRLALAAEAGNTFCVMVGGYDTPGAAATVTRWRVEAAGGAPHGLDPAAPGAERWSLTLDRARGGYGIGMSRVLEWSDEAYRFRVVAELADRADGPRAAGIGSG